MILVVGYFLLDPAQRDRAIELSRPAVIAARATPGCIDFAVSADSVDPARINVCERWTERASLDHFRGVGPTNELVNLIRESSVKEYEI